jgi:hypothetical protein
MFRFSVTAFAVLLAFPVIGAPLTLTPADPQPKESRLDQGLAVSYAYPGEVRSIEAAKSALGSARKGGPLKGLSYADNSEGDLTLTSRKAQKVAASISGYIKFPEAGTFELEVISNDGVAVSIGGQQVAFYDGIHGCESDGVQEVVVPVAGWYALEATYFQRKGTACLMMDWTVGGAMAPVPDSAFGH